MVYYFRDQLGYLTFILDMDLQLVIIQFLVFTMSLDSFPNKVKGPKRYKVFFEKVPIYFQLLTVLIILPQLDFFLAKDVVL